MIVMARAGHTNQRRRNSKRREDGNSRRGHPKTGMLASLRGDSAGFMEVRGVSIPMSLVENVRALECEESGRKVAALIPKVVRAMVVGFGFHTGSPFAGNKWGHTNSIARSMASAVGVTEERALKALKLLKTRGVVCQQRKGKGDMLVTLQSPNKIKGPWGELVKYICASTAQGAEKEVA